MFYVLKAWIRERGITQKDIAEHLGITRQSMSMKMNMETKFTLEECIAIKEYIKYPDCIDTLFSNIIGL